MQSLYSQYKINTFLAQKANETITLKARSHKCSRLISVKAKGGDSESLLKHTA